MRLDWLARATRNQIGLPEDEADVLAPKLPKFHEGARAVADVSAADGHASFLRWANQADAGP